MRREGQSQYNYFHVDLEIVASDIEEYIIPECQEACKILWNNNICTHMCSNDLDGDEKWIQLGKLSEENKRIIERLAEEDPEHYTKEGKIKLKSNSEEEASQELQKLVSVLKMQDVLEKGEAYQTVETFLISRYGLGKTIPNPDYKGVKEPEFEDYEDMDSYRRAYFEWLNQSVKPKEIEVLDESKMTKTLEEYIIEAGVEDLYDKERGVIYTSPFYRDMHQRYVEYMKSREHDDEDIKPTSHRRTPDIDDDGDR